MRFVQTLICINNRKISNQYDMNKLTLPFLEEHRSYTGYRKLCIKYPSHVSYKTGHFETLAHRHKT